MKQRQPFKFVLDQTSHPGNIGAAARAIKTMQFHNLALVSPQQYPHAEATARASGADDVLNRAVVHDSLDAALADCVLVVGASARLRSVEWPIVDPREAATLLCQYSQQGPVALLFGTERTGLSNEALDKCQYLVHIPSNPDYQSLNLAAAVQVLAYELNMALQDRSVKQAMPETVTQAQMEQFYQHMEESLLEIGFLKPPSYEKLLRRLRRIFHRTQPDRTELDILMGIMSAAKGRKYEWMARQGLKQTKED